MNMKINLDFETEFIKIDNINFSNVYLLTEDLYGWVDDSGNLLDKKNIIDKIKNLICDFSVKEIQSFFSNILGNCSLIISNNLFFYCVNSSTSPGLFYYVKKKEIYITDKENETFKGIKNLDINAYASSFLFHQGLIRDSKNSLNKKWRYLCSGCDLYLEENKETRSFYFSDQPPIPLSFGKILETIMKAYSIALNDVFVAKSGGIDSTCISVAYNKSFINGKLIHIPYFGKSTPAYKTSKEIAKKLDLNFELAESFKSNSNINSGLGISIGPEYEKFGFNYLASKYEKVNIITGQNLDSLYFIDSFAPSSNERGFIRAFKIVSSFFKRFMFSISFMRVIEFFSKYFSANLILKYIGTFLNGFSEHRPPFFFKDLKKNAKFKSLFESRENSYLELINNYNLDLNKKIRSLKYLKFVQNTHRNYFNLKLKHKINRINPFSEGPFVRFFLNYKLSIKDSFFIKPECVNYLKSNNVDYNKIASKYARSSFYYFAREIFFILPVNTQVFLGKIFNIKTSNYLFVIDSVDLKEIDFSLNYIKDLPKTEFIYFLINKLVKMKNQINISKDDKMLLFKLKNLNLLLREYS